MTVRRTIPLSHIVVLSILGALLLVTTQFFMKDVGYVYEEMLPHQRLLPRTLVSGYVQGHEPAGAAPNEIRLAHADSATPGWHVALSDQWPTFALTNGDAIYPILSETYQGNWLYYASYLWQGLFGHSLRSIRLQSFLLGLFGLLAIYLVLRRETDGGTALFGAALLGTNLFFVATNGFAFWFETVPLLLLLAGYGLLPMPGEDRQLWPSVLMVALAVSLKATVALVGVAFIPLWWPVFRRHPRKWLTVPGILVAAVVPMLPFLVHEILCVVNNAPHSSMAAYLAGRSEGLLTAGRLPGMALSTLWWLVLFGGNLNGIFAGVHGPTGEPWMRVDLVAWFVAGLLFVIYRVVRRRATRLERASLLLMAAACVMSLLLYQTAGDLQAFLPVLGFAVVPTAMAGMAAARWLAARFGARASVLVAVATAGFLLYGSQLVEVALDAAEPGALMANRADQAATAAYLESRDDDLPVVTTEHNHIGMIEHFTEGRVRPVHAYFPLSPGTTGERLRRDLFAGAFWVLQHYPGARFVVATDPAPLWVEREGSYQEGETGIVQLRLQALQGAAADQGLVLVKVFAGGSLSVWQAVNKVGP